MSGARPPTIPTEYAPPSGLLSRFANRIVTVPITGPLSTLRRSIARFTANRDLNFLLTNRIPRRLATDLISWFNRIEQPWVARGSIAVWQLFSDVDLSDARDIRFASLHACFTRALRDGARPAGPDLAVLASPLRCDRRGVRAARGRRAAPDQRIHPTWLGDLLGDGDAARRLGGGSYVTLRLTAGMYHHFHAPHDLTVERVTYISGDCWNVNPIALKRIERLFCKNERAASHCRLANGTPLVLVPVAAVLVASIRLIFLDTARALRNGGPRTIRLTARLRKGEATGSSTARPSSCCCRPAMRRFPLPAGRSPQEARWRGAFRMLELLRKT